MHNAVVVCIGSLRRQSTKCSESEKCMDALKKVRFENCTSDPLYKYIGKFKRIDSPWEHRGLKN